MKLLFLLPPSEGKNKESLFDSELLSFSFDKPSQIAQNATPKDLKCQWTRYEEGIELNSSITSQKTNQAIDRYSGVMYNAINYADMNQGGKQYFQEKFLIFSGLYGAVKITDRIANYKLPIETKGLVKYWWDSITEILNNTEADYIVDLLPWAYAKMMNKKKLNKPIVEIAFLKPDGKKISHGVKKIKWEWIHNICNNQITNFADMWGEVKQHSDNNITIEIVSE